MYTIEIEITYIFESKLIYDKIGTVNGVLNVPTVDCVVDADINGHKYTLMDAKFYAINNVIWVKLYMNHCMIHASSIKLDDEMNFQLHEDVFARQLRSLLK